MGDYSLFEVTGRYEATGIPGTIPWKRYVRACSFTDAGKKAITNIQQGRQRAIPESIALEAIRIFRDYVD